MLQQRHWGIGARQTKHAEDVVVVGEHKVFFHCNAILLQVFLWGMLAEPEIISNFFIQPRTENLKFTKAATGSPLPKSLKATSWWSPHCPQKILPWKCWSILYNWVSYPPCFLYCPIRLSSHHSWVVSLCKILGSGSSARPSCSKMQLMLKSTKPFIADGSTVFKCWRAALSPRWAKRRRETVRYFWRWCMGNPPRLRVFFGSFRIGDALSLSLPHSQNQWQAIPLLTKINAKITDWVLESLNNHQVIFWSEMTRVIPQSHLGHQSRPVCELEAMAHWVWWFSSLQTNRRRKFRSQTSDNMDRWKAEQGKGREKRKIRREKIREEKESEERRCRCAKR